MVVHGEEIPGQGIVCDLYLHVVIDAVGRDNFGCNSIGNLKAASKLEMAGEDVRGGQRVCLHAVPGCEVFVYHLPARQVAHSTGDLDSHVD